MSVSREKAKAYLMAGLSVLPANKAQKRPCLPQWSEFQTRLPTEEEVRRWFVQAQEAICIVCGRISGNLEVIDFDNHGELFPKWKESIPADLLTKLVIEQTPSGGYHAAYRMESEPCGNIKLAQGERAGKLQTLIETCGQGGVVLCAPTEGYKLQQGDYNELPVLTKDEREILLKGAYALDECNHDTQSETVSDSSVADTNGGRALANHPGDDFNARGDVRAVLQKHGWTSLGVQPDGNEYWQRPGKKEGNSATLKDGVFYVFSSNADPFESNRPYNAFTAYTLLEHNGDFGEAATELLKQGYGKAADDNCGVDLSALLGEQAKKEEPPSLQFLTARELLRQYRNMKEPLIDGLLRREEIMNIVAAPKTGKSWLVMQLTLALVTGGTWCGHECTASRVLLVDNELHRETLSCRLHRVASAMGISDDDEVLDRLTILSQRGAEKDIRLLKKYLQENSNLKFDVIIIDALYKALPKDVDENSNGQITDIYNLLDSYARTMGGAIVLVHHTSKGNQANKSITDVGSGAGAQSRSPDTHLTLRQHNIEGVVSVFCCVRSFPPVEPFCLRRDENNLWHLAEYDPNDMVGKDLVSGGQTAKRLMTVEDVADTIEKNLNTLELPMGKTLLIETIRDNTGASKAKAESALDLLCSKRILEVRGGDAKQNQQAMKCYYPGSNYPAV